MKDSQLVAAGGLHFPKYIKESNERFSTFGTSFVPVI